MTQRNIDSRGDRAAPEVGTSAMQGGRLARFGHRGLAGRVVAVAVVVLAGVALAQVAAVEWLTGPSAAEQGAAELGVGELLWRERLDAAALSPHAAAVALAADPELPQAIAADAGAGALKPLLQRHARSAKAAVVALLDSQFMLREVHARDGNEGSASLKVARVAPMLAQPPRAPGVPRHALAAEPLMYAAVAVPSPRGAAAGGWAVVGIELPPSLVTDLHRQTGLEVAWVSEPTGFRPEVAASTLAAAHADELMRLLRAPAGAAGQEFTVGGRVMAVRTVLHEAGDGALRVLLLRPLAPLTAQAMALQVALLVLAALGALALMIAGSWSGRHLTRSLRTLVRESERLARGEYGVPMQDTERRDEIGDLARAFDHMRQSIAANETEIRRLAYTDKLTEMPNRARFRDAVHGAIGLEAAPGRSVAVVMLDLDRLKHVNDVLGYASGDRLLKAVARRLANEVLRDGDLLARLGGDEFAILLQGADSRVALGVAQRITAALEQPLVLDDQTIDLGAGIGIACWPEHADDAYSLLQRAEVAMYSAKRRRQDAAVVYEPALDAGSAHSLSLMSELRRAVDSNQLRLYLQPKIALADGRLVGAEALVRWQHPERGLVPPMDFIPFAEQTGFVRRLTLWMFEEAARQWSALQAFGPLRISVNLSTRDLMDAQLPARLKTILTRHQAGAEGFCLEITESAIMDDPQRALRTLMALSLHDFKLSIDDFGTGYSSLAYLKRLPVNELKIDKSFVLGMASSPDDEKIVRSTIDLAHNLGLSVVAEGVENAVLYDKLAALRCDEAQGYHMSRPLPANEFAAWARQWHAGRPVLLPHQGAQGMPAALLQ